MLLILFTLFTGELPARNKKKVKKRGPRKREMLERERERDGRWRRG
jgi:hypothetical protein